MTLLSASSVTVELGGRRVLEAVDFAVDSGEIVGLLGPNGAGKTTLLRALAGLQALRGGDVQLGDRDVIRHSHAERARRLAYLPQGATCHWPMSVADVVALGRLPHRAPWGRLSERDHSAVRRAMAATDIAGIASRAASELSGGERARVLLARALAVEAPLLLADEPTAGLDPAHQLGVMEVLQARAREGAAVVVVLHDLTLAARFCDRLVLLDAGKKVADDVPASVLTDASLRDTYRIDAHFAQTKDGLLVVPVRRAQLQ